MHPLEKPAFEALVNEVARELVAVEHRAGGSFVRVPLLYPGGTTVVVRIQEGANSFFVTDAGLGYQEAELMGAGPLYARHARVIGDAAGVRFDNQAFFVLETSRDQLPGAVTTVANCSQEATMRSADALAEQTFEDGKTRLYERLVSVFTTKFVAKNVEVVGASNQRWRVAAIVTPSEGHQTVFEPVTKHSNSVASVTMKFGDIALRENAPARVAVVHNRADFGPLLTVLSRSASVIEDDAPIESLRRLASAA
jgi:hypothetical protein